MTAATHNGPTQASEASRPRKSTHAPAKKPVNLAAQQKAGRTKSLNKQRNGKKYR